MQEIRKNGLFNRGYNKDSKTNWYFTRDGIYDLIDVYVKNNWLYFQIWCPGWNNPSGIIKFTLKDIKLKDVKLTT